MKLNRLKTLFTLLITSSIFMFSCTPNELDFYTADYIIKGIVLDENGEPVSGIIVNCFPVNESAPDLTVNTSKDGIFEFYYPGSTIGNSVLEIEDSFARYQERKLSVVFNDDDYEKRKGSHRGTAIKELTIDLIPVE